MLVATIMVAILDDVFLLCTVSAWGLDLDPPATGLQLRVTTLISEPLHEISHFQY